MFKAGGRLGMGAFIFGYARCSVWKVAPGLEEQREAIAVYAASRGWPFEHERQLYVDVPPAHEQDFDDRPAGRALWARARRGDRLVVTSLDRAFLRAVDCAVVLRLWGNLGIELHAVDFGGPVQRLDPASMAEVLATMEKVAHSERAAVSAARSRHSGRPVNGSPPYGFEWTRCPRSKEWALVPDEGERALGKHLLKWYEAGHSIDQIRQHLQYGVKLEFYKQRGRRKRLVRWNSDAIWRRIQAERRLREQEAVSSERVVAV
jgi:DNA invertase Pin-like site-specific DNA recombinase